MVSSVLDLREVKPGIVLLTMQDKEHRNTFSPALVQGLIEAFNAIEATQHYKVVILTGYDSYFATGGTQEALVALSETKAQFTDTNLYSLPLICSIPVISAMQGHGIGGGFVFGMFADFVILSRESIYTTNFMRYGFTPGMGATLVLPKKFGLALGQEMLMGARNYRGAELEKRGIAFPVLPRLAILDYALEFACEIADKPRGALVNLKRHLVAELREQLPRFVQQELEMHQATFHEAEVKQRIETLYGK